MAIRQTATNDDFITDMKQKQNDNAPISIGLVVKKRYRKNIKTGRTWQE